MQNKQYRPRKAFTVIELLIVIGVSFVMFGLLLGAIQKVRHASSKSSCQNNLKNIGLAGIMYCDSFGSFPPGCSFNDGESPQPHSSWMARLLPFLGNDDLWQQSLLAYKADPFFENEPHRIILSRKIPTFLCPSDVSAYDLKNFGHFKAACTSYMGVSGTNFQKKDGIYFLDSCVGVNSILDGTSNTLAVGERPPSADGTLGWWYAGWGQDKGGSLDSHLGAREINVSSDYNFRNCRGDFNKFTKGDQSNNCDTFHFWSFHSGGGNFLYADGSVRFLSYQNDKILLSLSTRAGSEVVDD